MGGGYEYTQHTLDVHVLESDISLQNSKTSRTMSFSALDQDPELAQNLKGVARYTIDRTALVVDKYDAIFVNYGANRITHDSLWSEKKHDLWTGFDIEEVDLFPTKNELTFREAEYGELTDPFTNKSYGNNIRGVQLAKKQAKSKEGHILYSVETAFYDSSKYQVKDIEVPRYDTEGNIIFILKDSRYLITTDSAQQQSYHNLYHQQNWIMRLDSGHQLDTLFQGPEFISHYSPRFDLQLGKDAMAISAAGLIFLVDYNGDELLRHENSGSFIISEDGNSLTFYEGKRYFRRSDEKLIDLTDIVNKVTFSQPYENFVLVTENHEILHIVDSDTEEIISTVTMDQLPELKEIPGKYSRANLYHPLITSEGKINFLYTDLYTVDDPDNPCD